MFVPLEQGARTLRPSSSQISPSDWRVLSRFWYPVAVAGDVKLAPLKGRLLDVELVIYRTQGQVTVALDMCPHRYVRLSAGRIVNDRLACPFHGLEYDAAGQCTRIPSAGRSFKPPATYRLTRIPSEIRYGLVWACLDSESTESIPHFAAATEAGPDRLSYGAVCDWPVPAPRQIENFIDLAHIPFVHETTLGGDPEEILARPKVTHGERSVIFTGTFGPGPGREPGVSYSYTVVLPFVIDFETRSPGSDPREAAKWSVPSNFHMWNIVAPISAHQCRVFDIYLSEEPGTSPESLPTPTRVNQEDIEILGQVAQLDFPLDEKREIHIPVDNVSIEYRKHLRALGLGMS